MELRRKRFLKLWAKHFAIAVGIAVGGMVGLAAFVLGMSYLAQSYGPGITLGILAIMILLGVLGGMTHSITKVKFREVEAEEERTMAALRKEHPHPEPYVDQFNQYLNAHIQNMRNRKTLFKPKNTTTSS